MSRKFPAGTVVQLKSGGPAMVVSSGREPESLLVSCEWFVEGGLRRDVFDDLNLKEFAIPTQAVQ